MSVRYAPSPTGRFHIGNLRTAWVSREWAKALGVPWVVRFEDIDTPRVVAGALELQLQDLAALGMKPDRSYLQSSRRDRHWEVFRRMIETGSAYACTCSRKEIRDAIEASASAPHSEPPIYNGRCRDRPASELPQPGLPSVAWRFREDEGDGSQDAVIARTRTLSPDPESFTPGYVLACAVDDLDAGYSLVVRAWDLASSAPIQRRIQFWLLRLENTESSRSVPRLFHASLVTRNDGSRLEKRTRGVTLPELFSNGLNAEGVLARFSASFVPNLEKLSSEIRTGELLRERSLRSLGFV